MSSDEETTWNVPRGRTTPAPPQPRGGPFDPVQGVTVNGIDVPFGQLTLFFVKASLSLALALTLTSAVWVAVGGLITGITVGGWLALSAVWPASEPVAPGTPAAEPTVSAPPPPAPAPAREPEVEPEPQPVPEPEPVVATEVTKPVRAVNANESDAATEAILRAELERMRQRKGQ